MSRPWVLECFDTARPVAAATAEPPEMLLEEERLQAFDRGYRDGWDDAAKAHAEEQGTISAELASNLQALSFTYHEARNAILKEMEDILRGVVERVLPGTMVHSLGQMIVERVQCAADDASAVEAEIRVHPDNAGRLRELIGTMVAPPMRVVEEPTLGEGQAFIRLGGSEQKIDLEEVLNSLSEAVAQFFEMPELQEAN